MRIIKNVLFPGICLLLLLSACSSPQRLTYMHGGEHLQYDTQKPNLYDACIMPKDLLTIAVSCSEPELAAPFNLGGSISSGTSSASASAGGNTQSYLVDNNGNIDFPLLGELHLGGLTKGKAEAMIKESLKGYLKETPLVNVRLVNYKFTVIGEVNGPSTFTVANEKVNIFEALAMAGDMTTFGKREAVKLLREDEIGRKTMVKLNLQDPNIVVSPYYYLQQNDIIFVEARDSKSRNAELSTVTPWLSIVSILTTITSLSIVIFK